MSEILVKVEKMGNPDLNNVTAPSTNGVKQMGESSRNFRDPNRWIISQQLMNNSPSRRSGITAEIELSERRKAANFIRDMGRKLLLSQLCLNTGTLFMHRFFSLHSFTKFPKYEVATAAILTACKVEEQSRKLEHIVRNAHQLLYPKDPPLLPRSPELEAKIGTVIDLENVLLQTLGLDLNVDHVHTHVVKGCKDFNASKEFSKLAYGLATTSLMMTTFWVTQRATVVACSCILVASKVLGWEIPMRNDGKSWWLNLDKEINEEELEELAKELWSVYIPQREQQQDIEQ